MKRVITGSGVFLTGSEIADAVSSYGLALARVRAMDVVDIPFLEADGSRHRVQMRIGWGVETAVTSDEQPADELIEVDTIFDLLGKTRSLTQAGATEANPPPTEVWDGTDWDEII